MKIAINKCYGGFGLSEKAYEYLGIKWDNFGCKYNYKRTDNLLIKCIEELGKKANGRYADLKIIEIPDDVDFIIEDYDGMEWVAEKHKTWS